MRDIGVKIDRRWEEAGAAAVGTCRECGEKHRFTWHEVKLAAVVDARDIESSFYMASTGNAEGFGARLWEEFQSRRMDGDDLA